MIYVDWLKLRARPLQKIDPARISSGAQRSGAAGMLQKSFPSTYCKNTEIDSQYDDDLLQSLCGSERSPSSLQVRSKLQCTIWDGAIDMSLALSRMWYGVSNGFLDRLLFMSSSVSLNFFARYISHERVFLLLTDFKDRRGCFQLLYTSPVPTVMQKNGCSFTRETVEFQSLVVIQSKIFLSSS